MIGCVLPPAIAPGAPNRLPAPSRRSPREIRRIDYKWFARYRLRPAAVAGSRTGREEFLLAFRHGPGRCRTADRLYMRGTDPAPFIHVTHLGEPRFLGLGFAAQSEADLHRLATMDGASAVEDMDDPGGGRRVRLTDPHGYQVEVVWGRDAVPEIAVRRFEVNTARAGLARAGELLPASRPAPPMSSASDTPSS